jgi:hypothetical protein
MGDLKKKYECVCVCVVQLGLHDMLETRARRTTLTSVSDFAPAGHEGHSFCARRRPR